MNSSYLPEMTYGVCTNQMNSEPGKLVATRATRSVFYKEKVLLTKVDKNVEIAFTCKSPVNMAAAFLAFGAGLLVVASGPIGWCIAGAALAAGAIYAYKAYTHKCTKYLQNGNWTLINEKVYFDKQKALTIQSMLSCKNGGVVKPFFSYSLAKAAAIKIQENNIKETMVTTAISFAAGILGPASVKGISTFRGASIILGTNVAGLGVTWTLQYGQREFHRSDSDFAHNSVYQNMNNEVDKNSFFQPLDDPSDPNAIPTTDDIKHMMSEGKNASYNQNLNNQLSSYERMTTAQLRDNQSYRQLVKDIQKGKYGQGLKQEMQNLYKKNKATSSSLKKGLNYTANQANSSFKNALKSASKVGSSATLFFVPLLGTYFSEEARKSLAEEAVRDLTNGIGTTTKNPLGI